jgi:hypothetical protein
MYMRAQDSPDGITKLFGIVSRGWKCGIVGGYPGIYSPVHNHLAFIERSAGLQAQSFGAPIPSGSPRRMRVGVVFSVALAMLVYLT